jgi:trehalose/maltose transport system substrate-binding protein
LQLHYVGNHLSIKNVGFTNIPAGSLASVSTLGGSGLAISRYSLHPREDAELIRFLIREQPGFTIEGVTPDMSTQAVPYDLAASLGSRQSSSGLPKAVLVSRPSGISARTYDQVTAAYFNAVHSVLTGEEPAAKSVAELEKELIRITGFAPRTERKN